MFSIWGKVARDPSSAKKTPEGESELAEDRYFYSSSTGQILSSADGNGYVIPAMSTEALESAEFVPVQYAQAKLSAVVQDASGMKAAYQEHLEKVNDFYKNALAETKRHYEKHIEEVKGKAIRHVEVQKEMKKRMEEKLGREIRNNEEQIEELRDSLASRSSTFMEQVRVLKAKIAELESADANMKSSLEEEMTRAECRSVLDNTVHEVDMSLSMASITEQRDVLKANFKKYKKAAEESVLYERRMNEERIYEMEASRHDRIICQEALNDLLSKIELSESSEQLSSVEQLNAALVQQRNATAAAEEKAARYEQDLIHTQEKLREMTQIADQRSEEIDRLVHQYENEKLALMEEHEDHKAKLTKKQTVAAESIKRRADRAEVEAVLASLLVAVQEQCHEEEMARQKVKRAATVKGLHEQNERRTKEEVEALHRLKEVERQNLSAQYTAELEAQREQALRLEVSMCLTDIIQEITDRDLYATKRRHSAIAKEQQSVHSSNLTQLREASSSAQAQLAVYEERITQLGDELKAALAAVGKAEAETKEAWTRAEQAEKGAENARAQAAAAAAAAIPTTSSSSSSTVAAVPAAENKIEAVHDEATSAVPSSAVAEATSSSSSAVPLPDQGAVAELTALQELEKKLLAQLKGNEAAFTAIKERNASINKAKEQVKDSIKVWTKEFQAANGREPNVEDKAAIKDRYQRYKALSVQSKEIDKQVTHLKEQREQCNKDLADLREKMRSTLSSRSRSGGGGAQADAVADHVAASGAVNDAMAGSGVGSGAGGVMAMAARPAVDVRNSETQTEESGPSRPRSASVLNTTAALTRAKSRSQLTRTGSTLQADYSIAEEKGRGTDQQQQQQQQQQGGSDSAVVGSGESAKEKEKDRIIAELEECCKADVEAIEQLEDQVYQLKVEYEKLAFEHHTLEKEKAFVTGQLDSLVKEKRTDVVKRFEEQIQRMHSEQADLNEKVAALSATKTRNESKIKELGERVEAAERELKDRDAREQKELKPGDEKFILKGQIGKQREQIILKSKAATAGWDAAAKADEERDVEVERAYRKGVLEERENHKFDMDALNLAVEEKENRLTEMLVNVHAMERKVKDADEKVLQMEKQMDTMRVELADTIAGLGSLSAAAAGGGRRAGGGGTGGNEGEDGGEDDAAELFGPTAEEMEAAREELDVAQDELVSYMERVEKLEADLEVARKKNRIFERLADCSGLTTQEGFGLPEALKNGRAGVSGTAGDDVSKYDIADVITAVKRSIVKGTNLWKSNKRDECFDLYLSAALDASNRLLTSDLKTPLSDSIIHGKSQGAQNKQRGAVFLRKALDKFLSDSQQPGLRISEENAANALKDEQASAKEAASTFNAAIVSDLLEQLNDVEQSFLEQGYTKEKNPANSSHADDPPEEDGVKAGGEGEDGVLGGNNNNVKIDSSLLMRARAAEEQVKSLKRQLAAVISATASAAATPSLPAGSMRGEEQFAEGGGGLSGGAALSPSTSAAPASVLAARRGVGAIAGAGGGGGADPAEVRKLNRKIKELEAQLKSGGGGAGGDGAAGGGAGDAAAAKKAQALAEKQMQKKIKDMENAQKKSSKALEMRAIKAEKELAKINNTYSSIVSERDSLKAENAKLMGLKAEVSLLKAKGERCDEVEGQLIEKTLELATLAEQFKKETSLRKKYKNELEDLKGAIRVYARCRPMAGYEKEKGCKQVVAIKDDTSLKVITGRGEKEFEFDAVFSDKSTQDEVFEDTKRLVESCLDGFNVCLFAYGQTGSGKTFTMTGSKDLPGLTPKAIDELFNLIAEKKHCNIKVTTYFVELYNENLVDLYWILDKKESKIAAAEEPPKLDIKMDNKKMVYIRNCVIKDAYSPQDLMDLFNAGNLERHTGATKMNAESSRSHSIFAIMVESYDTATKRTTNGKLSLVDLAGSERADKTGAGAERLKEAQSINKSLSALGDVIAALSEGGKHIPYRNNKLTQLMQDSLGGNAKTLMFVNFSPADYNADETTTSLMYAARVKKIINNASKQAESAEVAKLKAIIARLKAGAPASAIEDEEGEGQNDEPEPPVEDDGKVYDGY